MIVSIHQPYYFPWLGYFDKILKSDLFILLDDVQYEKNNFYNRNRIRIKDGWIWITVPVRYKYRIKLDEIKIDNTKKWQKIHWKSIFFNYQKAPFFLEFRSFLEEIFLNKKWEKLIDLNIYTLLEILKLLEIDRKIVLSSNINVGGNSTEKIINLCKKVGADAYYSGVSGKKYLDISLFKENNIKLIFQEFHHPIYKQQYSGFIPNLSILDLLLNYGYESKDIIANAKKKIDGKDNL